MPQRLAETQVCARARAALLENNAITLTRRQKMRGPVVEMGFVAGEDQDKGFDGARRNMSPPTPEFLGAEKNNAPKKKTNAAARVVASLDCRARRLGTRTAGSKK